MSGRLDLALRWFGLVLVTVLGAAVALVDIGFAPLHWHGWRIPLTLLLAVVGNPLLVWLAVAVTGWRGAWGAPAGAWCVVWFAASFRRPEGDLLILPNNWVGVATTLLGPVAFGAAVFRLDVGSLPPPADPPGPATPDQPSGAAGPTGAIGPTGATGAAGATGSATGRPAGKGRGGRPRREPAATRKR